MTRGQFLVRLPIIVTWLLSLYGAGRHAGDDSSGRGILRHDQAVRFLDVT